MTVSSAFMSSRRERISFRVLSASDGAGKAAVWVDVLRALCRDLGKTDLDNTDVARDHSFHCIAGHRIRQPADHSRHVGLMVSISRTPHTCFYVAVFQLPSGFRKVVDERFIFSPVRKTQAGACFSASLPASLSGKR